MNIPSERLVCCSSKVTADWSKICKLLTGCMWSVLLYSFDQIRSCASVYGATIVRIGAMQESRRGAIHFWTQCTVCCYILCLVELHVAAATTCSKVICCWSSGFVFYVDILPCFNIVFMVLCSLPKLICLVSSLHDRVRLYVCTGCGQKSTQTKLQYLENSLITKFSGYSFRFLN